VDPSPEPVDRRPEPAHPRPEPVEGLRVILASASPARLRTLRNAGLQPDVIVSGVDEDAVREETVADLVARLAQLKAQAVSRLVEPSSRPTAIIGCDSMLELDGAGYGKPSGAVEAMLRWRRMSGRSAVLHTGHHVILRRGVHTRALAATAATTVYFAVLGQSEIEAYVATGEPLEVAGAFTVDGLGGAFVTRIEGDHHNVVGISLPLLRTMLAELGIAWTGLWPETTRSLKGC
jgi:septum formation protein